MEQYEKDALNYQANREKAVLKDLEEQYKAALYQVEAKIKILGADQSIQSRIYQKKYQEAIRQQIVGILEGLHSGEYKSINDFLEESYVNGFVGTAYSLANQGMPIIAPIDQAASVRAVQLESKISTNLYDALGIDTAFMAQTIRKEITRGFSSSLSYGQISMNIQMKTTAPKSNADRIVRTEGHRIYEASTDDARDAAIKAGCDIVKQWDSTMDGATRYTHRLLDGQIREQGKPFEVEGMEAQYPGEFGIPSEDINCRCCALTRAKWGLDEDELKRMQAKAEYFQLDKSDQFETFRQKYLNAVETVQNEPVQVKPLLYVDDSGNVIDGNTGEVVTAFVNAKTVEEAQKYAETLIADNVSYAGMSVAKCNEMNIYLTKLHNDFPNVRYDKVSTTKRMNAVARANGGQLQVNPLKWSVKELENGQNTHKALVNAALAEIDVIKEQLATGVMYGHRISPQVRKQLERSLVTKEDYVSYDRYSVQQEGGLYSVIAHEFGHTISDVYCGHINQDAYCKDYGKYFDNPQRASVIAKANAAIDGAYQRAKEDGYIKTVGYYSSKNSDEFFAENFALRQTGRQIPDYVESMIEEVINCGTM